MNIDSIVDLIVDEVYKKINESPKKHINKRLAVVVSDTKLDYYKDLLQGSYDVIEYDESVKDCDIVIVPFLCIGGMANLANLTTTNPSQYFIIKMLMSGKKVYLLEEGLHYRKFKNTAPKALYNKYLDFENTLVNYGVEIVASMQILENKLINNSYIKESSSLDVNKAEESKEIKRKKLISEADIRRLYMDGARVILVDKGSIITPLATDFIKTNNITIIRK